MVPEDTANADDLASHQAGRDLVIRRGPVKPSAEDIEKHNATHVPNRPQFPECVKDREREDAHFRKHGDGIDEPTNSLPKISLDYPELLSKPMTESPSKMHIQQIQRKKSGNTCCLEGANHTKF